MAEKDTRILHFVGRVRVDRLTVLVAGNGFEPLISGL